MKASETRTILFSVLFAAALSPSMQAARTSYPEGLEFLSRFSAPRYYYAQGIIEEVDSSGVPLFQMPFRFYWERGSYVLDARGTDGAPVQFWRKIQDTIWLYDFFKGTELIIMEYQDFPWMANLSFNPKDILPMFNIFPDGFPAVDSFRKGDSKIVVSAETGASYEFTSQPPVMTAILRGERVISLTRFEGHKRAMLPKEIVVNRGFLSGPKGRIVVSIAKSSLKRQPAERAILSMPVPFRMKNTLDVRP